MEHKTSRILIGLLVGLFLGFTAVGFVSGFIGYVLVKKTEADVRRGWNLVPVVVASRQLREGEVVTADKVAQRSVPEQFVTRSAIRPDAVNYILNQRLNVPLQDGDMLLWSQFKAEKDAAPSTP
jgi:pilus assembly protein CpaB